MKFRERQKLFVRAYYNLDHLTDEELESTIRRLEERRDRGALDDLTDRRLAAALGVTQPTTREG